MLLLLLIFLLILPTQSFSLPPFSPLRCCTLLSMLPSEARNTLGVDFSATQAEIKKAYRRAALKYHPDVNPSGRETFDRITEAYSLLTNKKDPNSSSSSSSYGRARSRPPPRDRTPSSEYTESQDSKYDTNGDSFSAIFSDLFSTAAGTAATAYSSYNSKSTNGVLNDLVDFLESNVDGFGSYDKGGVRDLAAHDWKPTPLIITNPPSPPRSPR